jgi:hypothetical protein
MIPITFIFPRWIFPKNIGDSINATIVPRLLGEKTKVITYGVDGYKNFYKRMPNVISVNDPDKDLLNVHPNLYKSYAFNNNGQDGVYVVYPEWHPNTFSFWAKHKEFLENHPTANLITVNFLLQLKKENLLFEGVDLSESLVYAQKSLPDQFNNSSIKVGVVTASKLAGRPSPHPNCNGLGLRYKKEHWNSFVKHLKKLNPSILVYEFGETNNCVGDIYVPPVSDLDVLCSQVACMDIGVMNDGGLNHVFNAVKTPVVLFTSTLINKAEFFKTSNSFYPSHLHLDCRFKCPSYFTNINGGEDQSKKCKLECEDLDPIKLAEYTAEKINYV